MRNDRAATGYDAPFGWWGPFGRPATARSVLDLIADGVLDPPLAGLLWAALARRSSLTVVAGPSGAGKTTLLTALLDLRPLDERRIYLRGCYEPFDFQRDPAIDPPRTALLVNEISPHLPLYLWGPAVRRLLSAALRGYRVLATAHAGGAEELIALLAGYPLRVPAAELASLGLVLALDAWAEDGRVRRIGRELAALRATDAGGIEIARLARRERSGAESEIDTAAAVAAVVGHDAGEAQVAAFRVEVERRATVLHDLSAGSAIDPELVAAALAEVSAAAGPDPPSR